MNKSSIKNDLRGLRLAAAPLLQAIAFVLIAALAIPACAAGERAIKSRVAPAYPELAKRMRITGMVQMEVTVDADGKVTEVKTVSGNRMLAPAAEDAVKHWKFEAGDGVATVSVSINFAM